MADIMDEIEDDLIEIGQVRDQLKTLPDIRPDESAIVVAGYPNVGKSSFVNYLTNARNEIEYYPFTTKAVQVGHFEHNHIHYQIVDTPGVLDRPDEERNGIESRQFRRPSILRTLCCSSLTPPATVATRFRSSWNCWRRSRSASTYILQRLEA
jgi:Predicted GTPase